MSEQPKPISLKAASRGLTVWCLYCLGAVENAGDGVAECHCDRPQTSETQATLEAMLGASRRGRTVG